MTSAAVSVEDVGALVRNKLLAHRNASGYWEGELSSSALSTATASFAFWLSSRQTPDESAETRLCHAGMRWLIEHQNSDGGWGDTIDSVSNISTTCLCWALLRAAGGPDAHQANASADAWLVRAAGSLQPEPLAAAITRRYGKDRTFSVPILTMCALAGQLGPPEKAWALITPLPFELAAFPQSWFSFLRMPVVSYALPALIAMGQVRHFFRPTRNPFTRLFRGMARTKTLRVLHDVQPPGGGFLEATPLTSFVVMCLLGMGETQHPVTKLGLEFLRRSARADGSWPIDTNLATWVTTLSVNVLASFPDALNSDEKRVIRRWLLDQQYKIRHPYTGAAPGGWAWTHLSGGVPDGDDTAGALVALRELGEADPETVSAACAGIRWLLDLQNGDGGIPTFCRGWTNLPFDRSAADLTAHALRAFAAWKDVLPAKLATEVQRSASRCVRNLERQQRADGSWVPLWFGNQAAPGEDNPTYGTSRVVLGLHSYRGSEQARAAKLIERGTRWLLSAQNSDGGWGGAADVASSVEETGLALQALSEFRPDTLTDSIQRGRAWLVQATDGGQHFAPAPIGLYFAKLWYSERLYPLIFTSAAL